MTAPEPSTEQVDQVEESGGTGPDNDRVKVLEAEVKRARDEAAKYRQRAREFGDDETYQRAKDAVAALEKAEEEKKTEVERLSEKNEGLLHRAASAEDQLTRLKVALGAGIPSDQADEFASRLRGDTEDDLKADAANLAKFFQSASTPARRGDPSQGHGSDAAAPADPLQAALMDKLGIATP